MRKRDPAMWWGRSGTDGSQSTRTAVAGCNSGMIA